MDPFTAADPPDLRRLVEDLSATLPLFAERHAAGRSVLPSGALLAALGQAYLNAGGQLAAFAPAREPGFSALTEAWYWPTGVGDVYLSYFLAGVVLARRDVCERFRAADDPQAIDWPRCLQWLLLHGASELQLAAFFHKGFVAALQADSVVQRGLPMTPLEFLVWQERPEWLAEAGGLSREALRAIVARWTDELPDAPLKALFQPRFERLRRPPLGRFKRKIVAVRR
jgi:hypothetical protein